MTDNQDSVTAGAVQPPTDRPLTAGDYESLADLHTIKGWLHGLATNPDLNDVVADGGVTTGDCYQQEACEFAGRIGRVIAALASPPVSERERELEGALRDAQEFIDGLGAELLNERTADWYPEGANNAASHMSEAMRLAGNRCADYQAFTAQPQEPV